jgi:3-oxoacyl-[acyl-carrier protein] reductase
MHQADLGIAEEVTSLVEKVREAHGRGVDILVSNAGMGKRIVDVW